MKKRVKLLTTIASLCLAVALMAFGVYAASSSTMVITSQVAFGGAQVAVTWGWQVEAESLKDEENTTGVLSATQSYATTDPNANWTSTGIPASVDFVAVNGDTITYTFTCKNDGTAPITVAPSQETFTGSTNCTVEMSDGTNDSWKTVTLTNQNDVATFTITYTLFSAGAGLGTVAPLSVTFEANPVNL